MRFDRSHCRIYHLPKMNKSSGAVVRLGGAYVFKQSNPAQFEKETPSYFLLNGGTSFNFRKMEVSLTGHNLLNRIYFDHLSRLRYYGFYNMGRNLVLSLLLKF